MDAIDLAVVAQDPWFGGGVRGQTKAFVRAARELSREPHVLYVARRRAISVAQRSLAVHAERRPGATAYPSVLPELDALNQLLSGPRLAAALRRSRSTWVVSTLASYGFPAALAGRPYGCWIGTDADAEWAGRRKGLERSRRVALAVNAPVLRRLERAVLRRAAVVLATTPASRAGVARAGCLAEDDVGLLPIPVDTDAFAPEPDERWLTRLERPTLVFVGRVDDPRKNVALLRRAFASIRRELPTARLRLVGPAGTAADGQDGVELVGEVESVAEELRGASLFVLPSLQEGFGIAACEALACGVPALVTPSGGPEHLVTASGGGVVLGGFSARELAGAAVELLRDRERLLDLRRRGRAYVVAEHGLERFRKRLGEAMARLDGGT
jgi:glycosyltransferase involved in cell wall biosynthesis